MNLEKSVYLGEFEIRKPKLARVAGESYIIGEIYVPEYRVSEKPMFEQVKLERKETDVKPIESTVTENTVTTVVVASKDNTDTILGVLDSKEFEDKAKELGLTPKKIHSVLEGKTKTHNGYTFAVKEV